MQKTFVGILLLVTGIVLFALVNANPVYINFWFWQVESNLSLVLILTLLLGALISFLFSLPTGAKRRKEMKLMEKEIKKQEEQIRQLKIKTKPEETKTIN